MTDEGDRWFRIEQDRKRDQRRIADRARRRALYAAQREQQRERVFTNSASMMPNIKMHVTEWTIDELGNPSRKIYAE